MSLWGIVLPNMDANIYYSFFVLGAKSRPPFQLSPTTTHGASDGLRLATPGQGPALSLATRAGVSPALPA